MLVKPRIASSADSTPSAAPHEHASLVIAGSAQQRMIRAIGAWYSASPIASSVRPGSRPSSRALAGGHAERAPRPRRVIGVVAAVELDSGPNRDLVADERRHEELLVGGVDVLCDREHPRNHHRSGMALGETMAVVEVERVGEHPVRERGTDRPDPARVQQARRLLPRVDGMRVVKRDPRRRRRSAGDAHGGEVGDVQAEPALHAWRDIAEGETVDERDQMLVVAGAQHRPRLLDGRSQLP